MSEPTAAVPVCYRHPDRETGIRCQRCEKPICPDCMTPASVGFQCPSCLKEGAKSVRTGRLPYGGGHSANPALTTFAIMAINLAVWAAIAGTGGNTSRVLDKLALLPVSTRFQDHLGEIVNIQGVSGGAWWQIVTSGFTQVAIWHIAVNMFSLYIVGPQIEAILGRARLLAVYGVSLIGSSAAVMLLSDSHSQTVGASGALFGLLGALLVIVIKAKINAGPILNIIGVNAFITVVGSSFISWQGHLGGFVVGALVTAVIVYAPKTKSRTAIQGAGVALILLASIALIAVRAHDLSVPAVPGLS